MPCLLSLDGVAHAREGLIRAGVTPLELASTILRHDQEGRVRLGEHGAVARARHGPVRLDRPAALASDLTHDAQVFADAGHLPANTTLQPTDPIAQAFSALMPSGFARPTAKELNNYWGNFGNALAAAIDKGEDSTKLVTDACAAMDKANNK